jgi:hypothetical protein
VQDVDIADGNTFPNEVEADLNILGALTCLVCDIPPLRKVGQS